MSEWFRRLTGLAEDDPATVRRSIRVEDGVLVASATGRRLDPGALSTPSLAELRAQPLPERGSPRLREIVAKVADLHADPTLAGAVFQVASQFNLLEMIGPSVTPEDGIARYADDPTQGPACAMACGAGTLWRNYFVPLGDSLGQTASRQLDMAADLHAALGGTSCDPLWDVVNGYLMPRPGGLARASAAIARGDGEDLAGALRVGVQADTEVTLEGAGHRVTQVFASACPVAYAPAPDAEWEALARLVLEAAYEATLRVAALRGAPVFVTRLGGGAFGNRRAWIDDALAVACRRLGRTALDIRMVSLGSPQGLPEIGLA